MKLEFLSSFEHYICMRVLNMSGKQVPYLPTCHGMDIAAQESADTSFTSHSEFGLHVKCACAAKDMHSRGSCQSKEEE